MTTPPPRLPSHPLWPTITIMTLLALVGGFCWGAISFATNAAAITASGPLGWAVLGPPMIASHAVAAVIGITFLPLWAVAGSSIFASQASGDKGSAARDMGVTLFSDSHEISIVTQQLAERMGLPPVAYIGWFPNEEINAFAMGNSQKNAMVALSKGAIERLTKKELIAVIGHELGHIASNDMARMAHAQSLQEALTFILIWRGLKQFARWVFTPLSELELLRMSRAREFVADEISAIMLGPDVMISALERLKQETVKPKTNGYAHLLMKGGLSAGGLLSTHPPLEKRIARLQARKAARVAAAQAPEAAPAP